MVRNLEDYNLSSNHIPNLLDKPDQHSLEVVDKPVVLDNLLVVMLVRIQYFDHIVERLHMLLSFVQNLEPMQEVQERCMIQLGQQHFVTQLSFNC